MDSPTEGRNLTSQLVMQQVVNIRRCTGQLEGVLLELLKGDPVSAAIIKEIRDSAARASLLLDAGGWETLTPLKPEGCPEGSVASPSSVDQRISIDVSIGKSKASQSGDGRRGGCRRRSQQHAGIRFQESKTLEDGHQWRKYGQKDILGSRYPRSYFRCTHKEEQGCHAQRQVQISDTDPSTLIITYIGEHTCRDAALVAHSISPSNSKGSCIISFHGNTANERLQATLVPSLKTDHDDGHLSNLTTGSSSSNYHVLHETIPPAGVAPVITPPPPPPPAADAGSLFPYPDASLSMDLFMTGSNFELDDLSDFDFL